MNGLGLASRYFHIGEENFKLAENLRNKNLGPDWYVIILFYAAVHYVNGLFVMKGKDIPQYHRSFVKNGVRVPGRASELWDVLGTIGGNQDRAYSLYLTLEKRSMQLRYEPDAIGQIDFYKAVTYKGTFLELKKAIDDDLKNNPIV